MLEARLRNPIMPLRVFAIPGLPSSSVIRGLLITGMFATFFIGVLYLERIRGYGALTTGLAFLPQTLLLAALSLGPVAWLVTRFGPRRPLIIGLASPQRAWCCSPPWGRTPTTCRRWWPRSCSSASAPGCRSCRC